MSNPPQPLDTEVKHDWRRRELGLAFTNAVKLGTSMLATWGIALLTRLFVPRYLGPERFGVLNYADAFAATAFVFLGLGLDQYVRKEVSVRPSHASDFIAGIIAIRMILLVVVYLGMEFVLRATDREPRVRALVYISGLTQYFMLTGATSSGLLQAVGKVNGVSILSVVIKLIWGASLLGVVLFGLDVYAVAFSGLVAEGARSIALFLMAKKLLRIEMKVDWAKTRIVILASLPFFVSGLATTIYDKIGINVLALMTNNKEVGWLGAASGLHGITFMFAPLVTWILTPLFARAAAASKDEFYKLFRRSLDFMIALATPITVLLAVGAKTWVALLYGPKFAPAAVVLMVLALGTIPMYLSIMAATGLAILNRTWQMSFVFVTALFINPVLNFTFISHYAKKGPGGGAMASALAIVLTEFAIVLPLLYQLGRQCVDRKFFLAMGKNIFSAAVVVYLDHRLSAINPLVRAGLDGVCLAVLALATGALDARGILGMLRNSRQQRAAGS